MAAHYQTWPNKTWCLVVTDVGSPPGSGIRQLRNVRLMREACHKKEKLHRMCFCTNYYWMACPRLNYIGYDWCKTVKKDKTLVPRTSDFRANHSTLFRYEISFGRAEQKSHQKWCTKRLPSCYCLCHGCRVDTPCFQTAHDRNVRIIRCIPRSLKHMWLMHFPIEHCQDAVTPELGAPHISDGLNNAQDGSRTNECEDVNEAVLQQ